MMTDAKELYNRLAKANTIPEKVDVLRQLSFLFLNTEPDRCMQIAEDLFVVSSDTE